MSLEFIHTEENGIKYLIHPPGSIFAGIKMRENHEDAFDNAIKRGMKNPENWMYMYSDKNKDFFLSKINTLSIIELRKNKDGTVLLCTPWVSSFFV